MIGLRDFTDLLTCCSSGTCIEFIPRQKFDSWRAEQSEISRGWLDQHSFPRNGYLLIPGNSGSLERVVVVYEDHRTIDFSSLLEQLPDRLYLIKAESGNEVEVSCLLVLQAYRFEKYKRIEPRGAARFAFEKQEVLSSVKNLVTPIYLVRDLINTPTSDLNTNEFSSLIERICDQKGFEFNQFVGEQLLHEGFRLTHAVGRASDQPPRLVEFSFGDKKRPQIAIVGKGVCYDSGGLNLKGAAALPYMKKDMAGAAHALALGLLLSQEKLPISVRVIIPLVENSISANCMRPGDVITARDGTTVEIINTDGEGRLVLAEAIDRAQEFHPELIVDFASLTGACRTALGTDIAGYFCRDDEISQKLDQVSRKLDDMVWRLPLYDDYKHKLKSQIADLSNYDPSQLGGAISAALFLEHFVNSDICWLHLDIMGWNLMDRPGKPKGGDVSGLLSVFHLLKELYDN